jgi:hypothetical protein
MSDDSSGSVGYRDIFAHRLAGRLWVAATVSYFGDFIGLGALLYVAYERSGGRPLGPAAVFAVQAVPAVAVAAVLGPWLDRIPRIAGLVSLCLIGAAALALPLAAPGLWPVLATAAIIGAVRTAFNSVRSGTMADGLPRPLRARLLGLMNVSYETCEVIGYVTGSGVAIAIGAAPALAADAGTFLVAAALLLGLRVPPAARPRQRSSISTGIRAIFGDQTLAMLAPVAWVGLAMGALPAALATTALHGSYRGWVPAAMAACAAGLGLAGTIAGRSNLAERVAGQLRYIVVGGMLFALTGIGVAVTPLLIVAGNFAVGAGMGWIIAAQTTFMLVIPPARMAHVTSTMIASLIALEGVGAVVFGTVANSLGVSVAYLLAGVAQMAAGLAGLRYAHQRPQALDITRPQLTPSPAKR